ncbi:MAG: hypothetical protein CVT95_06960 [Bacteroidetes bacterium HGW-Bacteroidetes-12]|nr:MAG: hypothetical protein CVT95_06960 [Bacteroidetes bacterium HGW-Bacteroidetes-12]
METKKTIIVSVLTTLATILVAALIMHFSCGSCREGSSCPMKSNCTATSSHCEKSASCSDKSECCKDKSKCRKGDKKCSKSIEDSHESIDTETNLEEVINE